MKLPLPLGTPIQALMFVYVLVLLAVMIYEPPTEVFDVIFPITFCGAALGYYLGKFDSWQNGQIRYLQGKIDGIDEIWPAYVVATFAAHKRPPGNEDAICAGSAQSTIH